MKYINQHLFECVFSVQASVTCLPWCKSTEQNQWLVASGAIDNLYRSDLQAILNCAGIVRRWWRCCTASRLKAIWRWCTRSTHLQSCWVWLSFLMRRRCVLPSPTADPDFRSFSFSLYLTHRLAVVLLTTAWESTQSLQQRLQPIQVNMMIMLQISWCVQTLRLIVQKQEVHVWESSYLGFVGGNEACVEMEREELVTASIQFPSWFSWVLELRWSICVQIVMPPVDLIFLTDLLDDLPSSGGNDGESWTLHFYLWLQPLAVQTIIYTSAGLCNLAMKWLTGTFWKNSINFYLITFFSCQKQFSADCIW